jgi:hypothetical protein
MSSSGANFPPATAPIWRKWRSVAERRASRDETRPRSDFGTSVCAIHAAFTHLKRTAVRKRLEIFLHVKRIPRALERDLTEQLCRDLFRRKARGNETRDVVIREGLKDDLMKARWLSPRMRKARTVCERDHDARILRVADERIDDALRVVIHRLGAVEAERREAVCGELECDANERGSHKAT